VSGFWRTSATTGDVVWQIATTCVTDAETGDPAFNSASTITDTAKGTTLQYNTFSGNTITVTGCVAGEELFFKLSRDSAHGSDTLAATADLISVTFNVQRII
jgi:glucose dehydrogenase